MKKLKREWQWEMKSGNKYIPARGDLVWLSFNPQTGHEQSGKRPTLVLSPKEYNKLTQLAIFCPITSHEKKYPFEVKISGKKIKGVILSDQIKSLDWTKRDIQFIELCKSSVLKEVIEKVSLLIE